ncbi:hypothetical protein HaLaN_13379, partial [Haematococcus lacustris]
RVTYRDSLSYPSPARGVSGRPVTDWHGQWPGQDELAARSSQQQPGPNTPPAIEGMQPGRAKGARGSEEKEWSARERCAVRSKVALIDFVAHVECLVERPPGARPASTTYAKSLERRTSCKLEAMKCSQGKQLGIAARSSQEQLEAASMSVSNERHP